METVAVKTILEISSPAFKEAGLIPKEYSCEGTGRNPELNIGSIPNEAKSIAIIVEDPDAPGGIFTHWVTWNIPPAERITAGAVPGQEGLNSRGEIGYTPPCPPSGTHRYYFKVFALVKILDIHKEYDKLSLEHAMEGHIVAYGELMGRYKKEGEGIK
jgi:Raf kinase inhibitor-like YbhB/YbcL family protein